MARSPLSLPVRNTRRTSKLRLDLPTSWKAALRRGVTCAIILAGLPLAAYYFGQLIRADFSWPVPALMSSALIVFGAPESRFARPRALVGGYLVSLVATLFVLSIPVPSTLAFAIAIALPLTAALVLDVLHPPAIALAVIAERHLLVPAGQLFATVLLIGVACIAMALLHPSRRSAGGRSRCAKAFPCN